jgi:hypothetical protein
MDKFWELLRQSVITQAVITIMVIGTDCYLFLTLQPVPIDLWTITALVVGFWFGAKSTFTSAQSRATLQNLMQTAKDE